MGASATVSLSTGKTFKLIVSNCETQVTHPTAALTDEFFDVKGKTEDGVFTFKAHHRNTKDEPDRWGPQVTLSGHHDKKPKVKYSNLSNPRHNPIPDVSVAGSQVTGEAILGRQTSNQIFGDKVTVNFSFKCDKAAKAK